MQKELRRYIDHTLLNPAATTAEIKQLCAGARKHKFMAVCVHPCHIRLCKQELTDTCIHVATVVGFPLGANLTEIKAAEAQAAIAAGANEIDMVINIGLLKDRDIDGVTADIRAVVKAACGRAVKVIIECDLLTNVEKVLAANACVEAGASMVKTSTGFAKNGKGATLEDLELLATTIAGSGLGLKLSGGVSDFYTARKFIERAEELLGDEVSIRIGTSNGLAIMVTQEEDPRRQD